VGSGNGLDERRLARAILAEQSVHLAGTEREVHPSKRVHAAESFLDPAEREQFAGSRHWLRHHFVRSGLNKG
jgi:hypothetical protein